MAANRAAIVIGVNPTGELAPLESAVTAADDVAEVLGCVGSGDGGEWDESDPRPAAWQEPLAYRSNRSGQSLASAKVEQGTDVVTFLGFGRTGAQIEAGLFRGRTVSRVLGRGGDSIDEWVGDRGEVEEAADKLDGRRVDELIVTIGINDVGFSTLVTDSVLMASGQKRKERIDKLRERIRTAVPDNLDRLKAEVDARLKPHRVLLTGYPVAVFQEIADGAKPCKVLGSTYLVSPATPLKGLDLDQSDAIDLTAAGLELNEVLQRKAEQFGWLFVDGIRQRFKGHGYCASPSRRFFVRTEDSCLNRGDFEGMLHPKKAGHEVTRDCIAEVLGPQLFDESWAEPVLHTMMA